MSFTDPDKQSTGEAMIAAAFENGHAKGYADACTHIADHFSYLSAKQSMAPDMRRALFRVAEVVVKREFKSCR